MFRWLTPRFPSLTAEIGPGSAREANSAPMPAKAAAALKWRSYEFRFRTDASRMHNDFACSRPVLAQTGQRSHLDPAADNGVSRPRSVAAKVQRRWIWVRPRHRSVLLERTISTLVHSAPSGP